MSIVNCSLCARPVTDTEHDIVARHPDTEQNICSVCWHNGPAIGSLSDFITNRDEFMIFDREFFHLNIA